MYRLRIKYHADEGYRVSWTAYGDLSVATLSRMTVQFRIGDDVCMQKTSWSETRKGWVMNLRPPKD